MRFLIEHACAGLFAEPGVGKTTTVYGAFKVLRKRGVASRMLVIAPLRPAYMVWPKEARKWEDFFDLRVEVLHGPRKEEALARDADVYVINPEGLDWLLGATKVVGRSGKAAVTADLKRFKAFGFDTLVVDELTRFKNTSSVRFKTLKAVLSTFQRRWGLTGTPAPNGLIDLFGQCYVLDTGRTFGQYITHFRSRYFVPSYDGFSYTLRAGADKEIHAALSPLVLHLAAADYVDLPELVENVIRFDLPTEARRVYDALEDAMLARLDGGLVTAVNAAAASMKCRQVANGGVYLDPDVRALLGELTGKTKREWADLHEEKVDIVADLVEELQGSPLLVAYDFEHDLARLRARFGADVPFIGGGVSPKRAAELEAAWNRGELPLLLGHPQSVAHGLNLQESGNHVCYHSGTWDFELDDQFVRRVYRQGSTSKRVFVHRIIARDTVDEVILWALNAKAKGQRGLFDGLRELRRRRK